MTEQPPNTSETGDRKPRTPPWLAPALLWAAVAAYSGWIGWLSLARHNQFGSYAYDLAIYDQALWLIAHGLTPFATVRETHILGDHFTPILYPLALFYRTPWGTELLLLFQTLALALGAWPLYRIGSRHSGSAWVGLLAGVTYLLYPPLRALNLFDFHPIALATPGLLFALDFALLRRAALCLLACAWTVLCKQEASIAVACLGIWYAVRWRQPQALAAAALAGVWLIAALKMQAALAGTRESAYAEMYGKFGDSAGEIAGTFLLTPWVPLSQLDAGVTAAYLLLLLGPLALLPLRAPGVLWIALFPFALNLFSNRDAMRTIDYQYTALLIPSLFTGAVLALARIRRGRPQGQAAFGWALCAVVAAVLVVPRHQASAMASPLETWEEQATARLLQSIPADASVTVTNTLVPHLSRRKQVYVFPNPFWPLATGPSRLALRQIIGKGHPPVESARVQRALSDSGVEYLVIGYRLCVEHGTFPVARRQYFARLVSEVLRSPAYGVVGHEAGVLVFRRGADHLAGLRRLGLEEAKSPASYRNWVSSRLKVQRL